MSDPVWPATLPIPNSENYGGEFEQPVIRTPMENGPSRVTRISEKYMIDISVSVVFDRAQQIIFRDFYDNEANAGADWIIMPIDSGSGVEDHRVRITSVSFGISGFKDKEYSLEIETEDRLGD